MWAGSSHVIPSRSRKGAEMASHSKERREPLRKRDVKLHRSLITAAVRGCISLVVYVAEWWISKGGRA